MNITTTPTDRLSSFKNILWSKFNTNYEALPYIEIITTKNTFDDLNIYLLAAAIYIVENIKLKGKQIIGTSESPIILSDALRKVLTITQSISLISIKERSEGIKGAMNVELRSDIVRYVLYVNNIKINASNINESVIV